MNLNKFETFVTTQKVCRISYKKGSEIDLSQFALPDHYQAFGVFEIGGRI